MNRPDLPTDLAARADAELVRAVAGGSTEALGRLYDRHAGVVYGLARRVLGRQEDAEEVVQDVFAQVWRTASRYEPRRASVAGWLVMLARTRAIDRLRSRRARPDVETALQPEGLPALSGGGPTPEAAAVSADDAGRVRRAMTMLPADQRTLVELAFFEGLTHVELAARTGAPLGTVKTRIRSAMTTLRARLAAGTER